MPTSKIIRRGRLIQYWVKKERSECLTHKKMLIRIEKDTEVSVECESGFLGARREH